MIRAGGVRIGWPDLPAAVRAAVEAVLGSPVVSARSQAGGFSPGAAVRVRAATGTRAFVKAVGTSLNPVSVQLHRREAAITAALPPACGAPGLLGTHDSGDWVAVVLDDVDGSVPVTPWRPTAVEAAMSALARVRSVVVAPPLASVLPRTSEEMAADFGGWARIAAAPPVGLSGWARDRLDALVALAARAPAAVSGDVLVHGDVRADNLLVDRAGVVRPVDWPGASIGAGWFDPLSLLVNVGLYGGHDLQALAAAYVEAPAADVDAVLAGLAGYFTDAARMPPPPGLPTLREFQAAQASSTLRWLRTRLDG